MKKCSSCLKLKPESEFQTRKASKDGLTSSCKSCLKERDAKRYVKERESRKEQHRIYMKTQKGSEVHKKAVEKWRMRNANKRAAHVILGNAVRDGKIKPLPCFVCGEKSEAHHPDYDRPLDVVWLCPTHHKQAHSLIK